MYFTFLIGLSTFICIGVSRPIYIYIYMYVRRSGKTDRLIFKDVHMYVDIFFYISCVCVCLGALLMCIYESS